MICFVAILENNTPVLSRCTSTFFVSSSVDACEMNREVKIKYSRVSVDNRNMLGLPRRLRARLLRICRLEGGKFCTSGVVLSLGDCPWNGLLSKSLLRMSYRRSSFDTSLWFTGFTSDRIVLFGGMLLVQVSKGLA